MCEPTRPSSATLDVSCVSTSHSRYTKRPTCRMTNWNSVMNMLEGRDLSLIRQLIVIGLRIVDATLEFLVLISFKMLIDFIDLEMKR